VSLHHLFEARENHWDISLSIFGKRVEDQAAHKDAGTGAAPAPGTMRHRLVMHLLDGWVAFQAEHHTCKKFANNPAAVVRVSVVVSVDQHCSGEIRRMPMEPLMMTEGSRVQAVRSRTCQNRVLFTFTVRAASIAPSP